MIDYDIYDDFFMSQNEMRSWSIIYFYHKIILASSYQLWIK